MKINYEAQFEIRLRSISKVAEKIEDSLNKTMKDYGSGERLKITANLGSIIVTVDKELTDEEQYKMKTLLESQMMEHMKEYDVRLVSFSRQTGNVQQSVLQSVE